METVAIPIAEILDHFRSHLLRVTLSLPGMKVLFCHRGLRLLFLFLFFTFFSLSFSLFFPLWVLALGPIIYGVPHLFSSFRFTQYSLLQVQSFRFGLIFCSMMTAVIGVASFYLESLQEILAISSIFISLFFLCFLLKKENLKRKWALYFSPLIPLNYAFYPEWTAGTFLLGHHWVAFFYWIVGSKGRIERSVSIFCTVLFTVLCAMVLSGVFDPLYRVYSPPGELFWAGLDFAQIGRSIFPLVQNYQTWFHLVVVYALGQSIHYFIWLKIIPDQYHYHKIPTSFRQSYQLLIKDFGMNSTHLILLTVFASFGLWLFFSQPMARWIYFCIAAFHGYFEIAGLFVSTWKPREAN